MLFFLNKEIKRENNSSQWKWIPKSPVSNHASKKQLIYFTNHCRVCDVWEVAHNSLHFIYNNKKLDKEWNWLYPFAPQKGMCTEIVISKGWPVESQLFPITPEKREEIYFYSSYLEI